METVSMSYEELDRVSVIERLIEKQLEFLGRSDLAADKFTTEADQANSLRFLGCSFGFPWL
jgi:hypothetical protein